MQQGKVTCKQLRRLHDRITEELRLLKEGLRETEQASFENPIETVNLVRTLQEVLNTVNLELAKCPPNDE
jgi:hypothetical protein